MFAKGPQPGYSPRTEALALHPTAVCEKYHAICGLVGYVVYDRKGGKPVASAGTSRGAWEKAWGVFKRGLSERVGDLAEEVADDASQRVRSQRRLARGRRRPRRG